MSVMSGFALPFVLWDVLFVNSCWVSHDAVWFTNVLKWKISLHLWVHIFKCFLC